MYAVGLMSGTSLDGVDAVLIEIEGSSLDTKLKVLDFETTDIPEDIKAEIKKCCLENESSVDLICSLNFKLGYVFARAVKSVCEKNKFPIEKLDFIASHGQTVYHIPKERNGLAKSTLQIGEPAIVSHETGATVISNFRVMDMAAGGEGAPLVPFSEYILYGNMGKNIALQNIGGIGNVTVIPNTKDIYDIHAFDTGPGNMTINEACLKLFGISYDKDGEIALSNNINEEMLNELMSHKYINQIPPKTTGREDFGEGFMKDLLERYSHVSSGDIITTLTRYTAKAIAHNYKKFIIPKTPIDMMIVGGGGAHNKAMMKFIKEELREIEVLTQEEIGYSSDSKEAIAFVILANETLHNSFSNVPSATGAKEKVVLGNIIPGRRGVFKIGKE